MTKHLAWLLIVTINVLLAAGDACAKHAAEADEWGYRVAAFGLWVSACLLWFPLMHARGFTRLVALADVIGILMLIIVGRLFLNERLNARENVGVALACVSALLLSGR